MVSHCFPRAPVRRLWRTLSRRRVHCAITDRIGRRLHVKRISDAWHIEYEMIHGVRSSMNNLIRNRCSFIARDCKRFRHAYRFNSPEPSAIWWNCVILSSSGCYMAFSTSTHAPTRITNHLEDTYRLLEVFDRFWSDAKIKNTTMAWCTALIIRRLIFSLHHGVAFRYFPSGESFIPYCTRTFVLFLCVIQVFMEVC